MGLWQWDPNPPRYRAVQSAEDFSRNSGTADSIAGMM